MDPHDTHHFTYVHFHLKTQHLAEDCKQRLTEQGVECVEEVQPFEAYGIIDEASAAVQSLSEDPDVDTVEKGDPPSCK